MVCKGSSVNSLLVIKELSISILNNKFLIEPFSLTLKPNETIAIMGQSGSGKTSLAYTLLGLAPNHLQIQGGVHFLGKDWLGQSVKEQEKMRGNEIALIFQDPQTSLNPYFTIGFQLKEVVKRHFKLSKKERDQKIAQILDEVMLLDHKKFLKAYPHHLSGGEKQRVLLAMALLPNPKLVIADEPTASLDFVVKVNILKLLQKIKKQRSLSLILITHDPTVAFKMADKVYEIKESKLKEIISKNYHLSDLLMKD